MTNEDTREICLTNTRTIAAFREDPKLKRQDQLVKAIYTYIIEEELRTKWPELGIELPPSAFILSYPAKKPYLSSGLFKKLFPISSKSEEFLSYIFIRYGINAQDKIAKEILAALQHVCVNSGRVRNARRFTAYDVEENALYLSRYDGTVYKIQNNFGSEAILLKLANGEESFLFVDDDGGNVPNDPIVGKHDKLIPFITNQNWAKETPGDMTPDQQIKAFIVWLFAVAFSDLFVTKPMIVFEGAPGSGKSSTLQLVQMIIQGHAKPLIISKNKGEDELPVQLLRSPIAVIDNIDDYISWLPDAICAYLTLGVWTKRKLYTDDEENLIHPQSFIAVASKNPTSFKREDTADRLIVLRLERRETNIRPSYFKQLIKRERDYLYGEWLYYLTKIIEEIERSGLDSEASGRMADWEVFVKLVAKVMEWPNEEVDAMLDALQRERDAFAGEADNLAEMLEKWLEQDSNQRRELTASDLFVLLQEVAKKHRKELTAKSPNSLAQKLRAPYLTKLFNIRSRAGHGGKKLYKIEKA